MALQAGARVVAEGVDDQGMMGLVRWVAGGGDDVTTSMVYVVQGFLLGYPSSVIAGGQPPREMAA
jgi:hypothetical protein